MEDLIRKRTSYKNWLVWYGLLKKFKVPKANRSAIMKMIHLDMDNRKAYKYRTTALYSSESLTQLIKDLRL